MNQKIQIATLLEKTFPEEKFPIEDIEVTEDDSTDSYITNLLKVTSTYIPRSIVKDKVERTEQNSTTTISGKFIKGTLIIADVSGFTAMSEALAELGVSGSEEVTNILNAFYFEMVDIVLRYGGNILKFGGDAITVNYLKGEDDSDAQVIVKSLILIDKMFKAMSKFEKIETARGIFKLSISVGMNFGQFFLGEVGIPEKSIECIISGNEVNLTALAEEKAKSSELVVTKSVYNIMKKLASFSRVSKGFYRFKKLDESKIDKDLLSGHINTLGLIFDNISSNVALLKRLRPYLIGDIFKEIAYNPLRMSFMGQHRPVTVIFLNFVGISEIIQTLGEENASEITEILNEYFSIVLDIILSYGGVVNKVDTYSEGDKLMVLFGAPKAREDDHFKAVCCAMELLEAGKEFEKIEILDKKFSLRQRIGINSGLVFAGNVGSPIRKEYTVMGDNVNLAARILSSGDWGGIYVSESTYILTREDISYEPLKAVKVKGKKEAVKIFKLLGNKDESLNYDDSKGKTVTAQIDSLKRVQKKILGELSVIMIDNEVEYSYVQKYFEDIVDVQDEIQSFLDMGIMDFRENDQGTFLSFCNPIIQEVVLNTISYKNRIIYHNKVALIIQNFFGEEERSWPFMAHHFKRGGSKYKSIYYQIKEGDFAYKVHNYKKAISLYTKCLQEDSSPELQMEIMKNLIDVYYQNGQTSKAQDMARFGQEMALKDSDLKMDACFERKLGSILRREGDLKGAHDHFKKSLKFDYQTKDHIEKAYLNNEIGLTYQDQGDLKQATEYFFASLEILRPLNSLISLEILADTYNNLAQIKIILGEYDLALGYFQESLAIFKEKENEEGMVGLYNNMGSMYILTKEYQKAIDSFNECLQIEEKRDDKNGMATSYNNISSVYNEIGDESNSILWAQKSLEIMEELGDENGKASIFYNMGQIARSNQKLDESLSYFMKALDIFKSINHIENVSKICFVIGHIHSEKKDYDYAITWMEESAKIEDQLKADDKKLFIYSFIGEIHKKNNKFGKYLKLLSNNFKLKEKIYGHKISAYSYLEMSDIHLQKGHFKKSYKALKKALSSFKSLNDYVDMAKTYFKLGQLFYENSKLKGAKKFLNSSLSIYKKQNDYESLSHVQSFLAKVYVKENNFAEGIKILDTNLENTKHLDNKTFVTNVKIMHGVVLFLQEKFKQASLYFESVSNDDQESLDKSNLAILAFLKGLSDFNNDQQDISKDFFAYGAQLFDELLDEEWVINCNIGLIVFNIWSGDFKQSLELIEKMSQYVSKEEDKKYCLALSKDIKNMLP